MSARAELARLAGRLGGAGGEPWIPRGLGDQAAARRAAVLILFGRLDDVPAAHHTAAVPDDLDVLLVQRADTLRDHPGQVAFPGGGIDPQDASPAAAALREAREETGLDPDGVEVLGELPATELPVSNFLVTPVLGWWARPTEVFAVDPGESAHVFRAPVADLLDPAHRGTVVLRRGGRVHRSDAFDVAGATVWGFTGIILSRLFDELGWTRNWDRAREIPVDL